jgi:prepilin-type N-terminal cleavage/methylation domain-containing protein
MVRSGFTLVELVMVVTIIAIISAIAVPRVSSSANQSSAGALKATLSNIRSAIDIYYAEHNRFPGYDPSTGVPNGDQFIKQLTLYSDGAGNTNRNYSSTYVYGPYLRAPFPVNPANKLATVHVKPLLTSPDPADGSVGWVAVLSTGDFSVSATDTQLDIVGIVKPSERLEVRNK